MSRILKIRKVRPTRVRFSHVETEADFVIVKNGPNKGYKISSNFKNRNPRNLEMMNIAHRDKGWAAGPNNQRERFVPYFEALGEDRTLTRQSVTNLPAHNGYHSIEILKKDKSIDGICRHYSGRVIALCSSSEAAMSNQLLSKTDRIAAYFVGNMLGARMHMAGITNCVYPFLPSDANATLTESEENFLIGIEETGIIIEDEPNENSIWNQVKSTDRKDNEIQSWTRGETPTQIKNNKGSMFD